MHEFECVFSFHPPLLKVCDIYFFIYTCLFIFILVQAIGFHIENKCNCGYKCSKGTVEQIFGKISEVAICTIFYPYGMEYFCSVETACPHQMYL